MKSLDIVGLLQNYKWGLGLLVIGYGLYKLEQTTLYKEVILLRLKTLGGRCVSYDVRDQLVVGSIREITNKLSIKVLSYIIDNNIHDPERQLVIFTNLNQYIIDLLEIETIKLNTFTLWTGKKLGHNLINYTKEDITKMTTGITSILFKEVKNDNGSYYYTDIMSFIDILRIQMENTYNSTK